jgi:transposase
MLKTTRFVGLDVHAETIEAAIGEGHGKARHIGRFPNRPEAVRKLIERVGGPDGLKVCYEAGPTGYALYWQLTKIGRRVRGRRAVPVLCGYSIEVLARGVGDLGAVA